MNIDSIRRRMFARFDLRHDQAETTAIDSTLRGAVEFRGTNLWVLVFAIFMASIGLNVNSTAVVIGAMLISPLMGPIMALGYGAGINDSALMRSSLFNLALAAFISLLTSTVYFLLTPLTQAHSELLARTTPSIWDVLIALFGGLAGVIGATRQVKSNLIPGVAIATALMPPLCTAGYGLATGNWPYFFGAFYLFSINCVFIAIATLMMVRVMRLPSIKLVNEQALIKRRVVIGVVVLATLVPSVFLAIGLVQKEWFESSSARFVQEALRSRPNVLVVSQEPDFNSRTLRVNLAGDRLPDSEVAALKQRLPEFGLANTQLALVQSGQVIPDLNLVKRDLINELLQTNRSDINEREARIAALQTQLQALQKAADQQLPLQAIYRELRAQFPKATGLSVSAGYQMAAAQQRPVLVVRLQLAEDLSTAERERLRLGLQTRAGMDNVGDVQLDLVKPSKPPAKTARKVKSKRQQQAQQKFQTS